VPETVGLYLAAHAESLAVATLTRRLSTIATAHRMAGHGLDTRHPGIRDVLRGLRRAKGVAPHHAEALTTPLLRRVLATCGERLIDRRDRALLLVGFAGALRRSELVALRAEDVAVLPEGLRVTIRRTGTTTCPVAALEGWLAVAEITSGRVFRSVDRHGKLGEVLSTRAVAQIVQTRAARAGLDPTPFSGHSMRAGFATSAAAAGVEERVIMRQTRHKSV
jgi:integrase